MRSPVLLAAPILLAALAQPALAAAGDMNVATFLAKADALQAKGVGALLSSDFKLLQSEGKAAGAAYRARLKTEGAQGHPSSCPPAEARVNSNQLLAHLRSYAPAVRAGTSLKTAMADYFIKTWPCR